MKKLVFLFLLPFAFASLNAQPYTQWMRQAEEGASFQDIQRSAEDWYRYRDQGRGSGYRQFKRWEYLVQDRLDENGAMVNFSRMIWDASQGLSSKKTEKGETENEESCQAAWNILAPLDGYTTSPGGYNPGLGRVNVVAFHPGDPNVVFCGTPAGGLWKTNDLGGSWFPLTDHLPSIGVSGIAIHPTNHDLMYILTGDGDGADTYCIGVLKSTDGGQSWEETGMKFGPSQLIRGYKLAMYPNNPDAMLAATSAGLLRTVNGGANWSNIKSGHFVDIEFHPANPSIIYASTQDLVYRSTNGGIDWVTVSSGLPSGENRIALGVSPANPDYLYVLAGPADGDGVFKGLYRSVNSGGAFSAQATTPNILGYPIEGDDDRSQSAYDLAIAVDPDDGETVITGGINVWRSTDGGFTLNISAHWYFPNLPANGLQYTHADIHELVYNPHDGSLWCGSDGGIFVSYDDGITWEDRSSVGAPGLAITQFYRISSFPGASPIIIGGTQDNGSNRWDGDGNIRHFDGADGMDCMIHPADSMIQYHTRQNGGLRKSADGGESHFGIKPGVASGYWITPLAMHPTDPETIYAAYRDTVYTSFNGGEDWTPSIPAFNVGTFRCLHVAPADPNVIYAATDLRIFRTQDAGASWTEITSGLPSSTSARMTMIATDADNADEVWVTHAGFSPTNKVFYSSNGGATWQNISTSLPNLPVNCIIYEASEIGGDNAVYVGTDVGVYYRDSSLSQWIPYNTGLPNVPVFDLEIHKATGMLQAGTFGRGIWETPLYQPDMEAPAITCPEVQTVFLNTDCIGILPNLGNLANASDNCDPSPDILQAPAPGTAIYQDTLITLTAADWEGNSISCEFSVKLTDNSPPVFQCPEDIEVYTCAETAVEYEVSWADNCTEAMGQLVSGLPSGSLFPVGATEVQWTASDTLGNTATCSFTVTITNSLEVSGDVQASCPNDSTGTATAIPASGIPPFTYQWDDPLGQSGETATDLAPGAYNVIVADSTGCAGTVTLTVGASPAATITVNAVVDETSSQGNGSISVTIAGGVPPYQYQWRKDGEVYGDQEDLSDLSAGVYVLEITDANGCVFTSESVLVDNLSSVGEAVLRERFKVYPNPARSDLWAEWTGPLPEGTVVILLDSQGRELWRSALGMHQQLQVSGLPAGSYLVRISGEGWQVTERVVVAR
ncbi:MAG: HYR domain-containing protein [Saprospiraceae bacterium]